MPPRRPTGPHQSHRPVHGPSEPRTAERRPEEGPVPGCHWLHWALHISLDCGSRFFLHKPWGTGWHLRSWEIKEANTADDLVLSNTQRTRAISSWSGLQTLDPPYQVGASFCCAEQSVLVRGWPSTGSADPNPGGSPGTRVRPHRPLTACRSNGQWPGVCSPGFPSEPPSTQELSTCLMQTPRIP